jgi:two-component system NtrC family sensor kinase
LVLLLAAVLIAYGAVHTYLTAKSEGDAILSEATAGTLRLANTIRRSTRHAMLQSRREDVHKMIENVGEQEGIDHVRILNKQGVIVYSSNPAEINGVVDKKAEACYQCHDARLPEPTIESTQRARVFETDHGHRTLAAIDVIYNEPSCWNAVCHAHSESQKLLGVVDVGVSLAEADLRVARGTRSAVLLGAVSTAVICALVAWFIYRFVSRPVGRLLECTRKVARGDLCCTLQSTNGDEIGQLTRSFLTMTEDLRKARTDLSEWAHKLEREVENKTRDLRLAQAQVVRSEKLSSVGLLAAGVAHELNSPLMGILTFAQLVSRRVANDARMKKDLQVIIQQTERCATIIRQLLDFSRETPSEKKSMDIHAILEQAIALVEHQAFYHDIEIRRDFDRSAPLLLMDAGQMQQVFLNLLVNAGEAMASGGCMSISTRAVASAAGANAADEIHVVFSDTGIGIPQENLHKIFDPFFTSKEVGRGTGLGLAVSYGIIERHGGKINVESAVRKGTTFTIVLPVAPPAANTKPATVQTSAT